MVATIIRTAGTLVAAAALTLTALVSLPAAGAGTTAHPTATVTCKVMWGSLTKTSTARGSIPVITNVRAGRHACYDRVVVDLAGPVTGYTARYVTTVRAEGSGAAVPVRGGARLQLSVDAVTYDTAGHPTLHRADLSELVPTTGYSTLRQVAWAGSFEARTTLGIGVRARLPFRVFVLDGPGSGSRVVIDIAHHW